VPAFSFLLLACRCIRRRRRPCSVLCESKQKHTTSQGSRTSTHTHTHRRYIFSFLPATRCCKEREKCLVTPSCLASGTYTLTTANVHCVCVCEREYRASNSRFDFLLIPPAAAVVARYNDSNDNDNAVQKY
jgi:hypothetical protein